MNHSDRFINYQIRIEGFVRPARFDGFTVTNLPEGETLIRGIMDQSALHGILNRIRDLGLVLLSVQSLPNEKGNSHE